MYNVLTDANFNVQHVDNIRQSIRTTCRKLDLRLLATCISVVYIQTFSKDQRQSLPSASWMKVKRSVKLCSCQCSGHTDNI